LNGIYDVLSGDDVWNGHDVFMESEVRFGCFEVAELHLAQFRLG
jgi:hypothetical protein